MAHWCSPFWGPGTTKGAGFIKPSGGANGLSSRERVLCFQKKENKVSQESLKSGNTKSIAAFLFSPCALSPIHIWVPPVHTWACDYACFGHVMDTVMIMYV
jgi:hypothetical protein